MGLAFPVTRLAVGWCSIKRGTRNPAADPAGGMPGGYHAKKPRRHRNRDGSFCHLRSFTKLHIASGCAPGLKVAPRI